ncbi:hypothetical protein AVEN_151031-1 [Araneus ventricosus]|uniref:Uncharacterized protein n=1 Tax=Araneus ventricosus TaxID=182803 RepID=A0A4Y2IBB8_ARAVE|nr:hypothetical protein AVEN_151031-1 [Araneus ventricosus]
MYPTTGKLHDPGRKCRRDLLNEEPIIPINTVTPTVIQTSYLTLTTYDTSTTSYRYRVPPAAIKMSIHIISVFVKVSIELEEHKEIQTHLSIRPLIQGDRLSAGVDKGCRDCHPSRAQKGPKIRSEGRLQHYGKCGRSFRKNGFG